MKSLFLPFTPSLGHVSRCLAVAEAWQSAGHEAVFGIGPERRKMVQKAGFETHLLPEVSAETFRTDRGGRWLSAAYFTENLSTDRMLIQHTKPDVVVGDFRFTASSAALLEELPCACILHGNALRMAHDLEGTARLLLGEEGKNTKAQRHEEDEEQEEQQGGGVEEGINTKAQRHEEEEEQEEQKEGGVEEGVNTKAQRHEEEEEQEEQQEGGEGEGGEKKGLSMRKRWLRWLFPRIFQNRIHAMARRINPALTAHKLPRVASPFALLTGDLNLLADLPEFLPTPLQEFLPGESAIVGPLAWSGWSAPAPWLDEIDGKPLVTISLGSTAEIPGLLEMLLEALQDAPYNAVITTAGATVPEAESLPANVRVFASLPGATVMARSAAAVHLGGQVTLMQALAAGVPSLIIPANPDQLLTARLAVSQGLAHLLWLGGDLPVPPDPRKPLNLTPEQLRQTLDDLLADERCAQACQEYQTRIAAMPGAEGVVPLLENVKQVVNEE